jgi:Tol biopolymer transport system component
MNKLALLAALSATAALSFAGPKPKKTLLFTLKDHTARDPAVSPDGRRIYFAQDTLQFYMYDRTTRRLSPVLGNMPGIDATLAVSPAGDRLAFARRAEGGGEHQLWIVSLDPNTGLPNATPRRVSVLAAVGAAFSPDGKSIAFATPTAASKTSMNVVVVPANGGPERVIAENQGDIWPIMWYKPDSISYGSSFDETKTSLKSGLFRVGVSGGKPQFVMRTAAWGNLPGLSRDGRFIAAADPTWDSIIVATASGKRLSVYVPDHGEGTPDVWSVGSTSIGWRSRATRALHVVDLTGEQERTIGDTAELFNPVWSQDGKRLAMLQYNPGAIVVSDVAAGTHRSIPLERVPSKTWAIHWSPDGRFLAYHDGHRGINLLDPATSKVWLLAANSSQGPSPRWRGDSRAVLYGVSDPDESTDSIKKIEIHEVTTDGRDRLLRSIQAQCNGGLFCGKIIDDSLVSTWINGEYRVTNFRTGATPRLVYKRDGMGQPVPTFSSNGRWMAVRHQSAKDQRWTIELMHPDGSSHRSVPLSFRVSSGGANPWISDDGSQLIVASPECVDGSTRCNQHAAPNRGAAVFYRVDVATGNATAIAPVPGLTRGFEDMMISNDGRSLVYLREVATYVDFYEFDFSDLLKGGQP